MLPGKRWNILNTDTNKSVIDTILENRNLSADHLEPFRLTQRLHSPYLLPDMEKAVKRILAAIENNEKIFIFGDYDADGITSAAVLLFFFRKIDFPVNCILPHREKDGYGLRIESVDKIAELGGQLLITVDNGISSNDAAEHAAKIGLDLVITDHHLQEGDLPEACAIVNPNRKDSKYPFKTICGAAVAFKVVFALAEKLLEKEDFKQFILNSLDLVTIGTIADVMPIRDENYALVKFGLKVLSATRKPGLAALKRVSGVKERSVTPVSVGFFLAPRLNAAGRLGSAEDALKLLSADSIEEANHMAAYLDKLNRDRQKMQTDYLNDALRTLDADEDKMNKVIFVENENWHPGLTGLVSGQLKELYYRPALAFAVDSDNNYVGSARSIDSFHITKALTKFSDYFVTYGGHRKAAGLTVHKEHFSRFKQEFTAYADEQISADELVPELTVDSIVDIEQANLSTAKIIQEIGPFGEMNPEPVFVLQNAQIHDMFTMTNGRHLKFTVQRGNQTFECVWWRGGENKDSLWFGQTVDIAFRFGINSWQGKERLQLVVEDASIVS